jgi:hypothetical protein
MTKRQDQLFKLAAKIEQKYCFTKQATTSDELKRVIIAQADRKEASKIPMVNNLPFNQALEQDNRNAVLNFKYDTGWFAGGSIKLDPEGSGFIFEEGTPEEVQDKYRMIPAAIEKFLNTVNMNFSGGPWRIQFP